MANEWGIEYGPSPVAGFAMGILQGFEARKNRQREDRLRMEQQAREERLVGEQRAWSEGQTKKARDYETGVRRETTALDALNRRMERAQRVTDVKGAQEFEMKKLGVTIGAAREKQEKSPGQRFNETFGSMELLPEIKLGALKELESNPNLQPGEALHISAGRRALRLIAKDDDTMAALKRSERPAGNSFENKIISGQDANVILGENGVMGAMPPEQMFSVSDVVNYAIAASMLGLEDSDILTIAYEIGNHFAPYVEPSTWRKKLGQFIIESQPKQPGFRW